MKHELKITILLIVLFLAAQIIGLFVTNKYLIEEALPYDIERPEFKEQTSFIPIFIAILIATFLILLLAKFKAFRLWKFLLLFGVSFALLISLSAFINEFIALLIAVVFAIMKVFKPNVFIHNLTELFIYGGLAGIFVPILNLFSISILIIIISIYDFIAVWRTKHMIKLAKFQSKAKIFAGLFIPYGKNKTAILGGGDIGFPLLFAGVVLKTIGFKEALVVSLFVTLALTILLMMSKKNKFYPAMPFLTAGCFLGYFVTLLF